MRIDIDATERDELIQILEVHLGDTRSELRRTRTTEFRENVRREEKMLERLLEKLRHATSGPE